MCYQVELSVIIPIYKVEDYLINCVESVINQDFKDLEIILVDDGSPDRCPQICDELSKKDSRIKVIHKSNGGLSSARNAGLEISTGKYVTFLDSDDRWGENKLLSIMKKISEYDVDIFFLKSLSCYPDGTLRERYDNDFFNNYGRIYDRKEIYPLLINEGNFREQAGTHIIKTSFLKKNNLYFREGILGEDSEWMIRALRVVNSIVVVDDYLQIYTSGRAGSITNSICSKSVHDLIYVIKESLTYYKYYESDVKKWELAQCAFLWTNALGFYTKLDRKNRDTYKKQLTDLYSQLPLDTHPKSKIVNKYYRIFGFFITTVLLRIYIKLRKRNFIPKTHEL